jgi:hypothetical protein
LIVASLQVSVAATKWEKAEQARLARPTHHRLSTEVEIISLQTLAPGTLSRLPQVFAESVIDSAMRVLGESTGEAFIRWIGDGNLSDPDRVYSRMNTFSQVGLGEMKKVIQKTFSSKVHSIYKLAVDLARENLEN